MVDIMKYFYISLALIILSTNILHSNNDSLEIRHNFDDDYWKDMLIFGIKKPTIDISIGLSNPSIDKSVIPDNMSKLGYLSGVFGFSNSYKSSNSDIIFREKGTYLLIEHNNIDLPLSNAKNGDISSNAWRIGVGSQSANIYDLGGNVRLSFNNLSNIGWVWINFRDSASTEESRNHQIYLSDGVRFSNQVGNEIKLFLTDNLGFNLVYNRTEIFTRHLFWYWAGSEIIYQIGSNTIDWFVSSIEKSTPSASPIIYFVLHSVYNYGMYELRKSNMNWPFDTSSPLIYDNFKFGLSFRF